MKKPYVLGIAGGTASGKSTLSDILEQNLTNLDVKVLHMDEYYIDQKDRDKVKAYCSDKMYYDDNHPSVIKLRQLNDDIDIAINEKHDVIIVEGFLTLWDEEILSKLDLKLFVDCNADERIIRRIKRNMPWGLSFDEITDVYLDMVRYRHEEFVEQTKWRADLILNGSKMIDSDNKSVRIVLDIINNNITL